MKPFPLEIKNLIGTTVIKNEQTGNDVEMKIDIKKVILREHWNHSGIYHTLDLLKDENDCYFDLKVTPEEWGGVLSDIKICNHSNLIFKEVKNCIDVYEIVGDRDGHFLKDVKYVSKDWVQKSLKNFERVLVYKEDGKTIDAQNYIK